MDFTTFQNIDIDNILYYNNNWGIDNGTRFVDFFRYTLKEKLGKEDITFSELKEKTGKEIISTGTNLNKTCSEIFSVGTTPNMKVIDAIRSGEIGNLKPAENANE